MTGRYVLRKGGWDTHGLPVEVEVCKELGIGSGHVSLTDDAGLVLAFAVVEAATPDRL